MGGTPVRALRLSPAGAAACRRWRDGDARVQGAGQQRLARLLHASGAGHLEAPPRWTPDDVTVVVPVRDRPEQLARCLAALAGCRVLVVDDASRVAVPGALRLPHNLGPAGARNAGLARVRTPLVAFVDSDCVVPPGWLDGLLPALQEGVALVAPRVVGGGGTGLLARYEQGTGPLDLGRDPGPVRPRARVGHVPAAVLLGVVAELGTGFDEDLRLGEDVDLVWRLARAGRGVRYVPSVVVRHETRAALSAWCRQRAGYGRSAALLDRRHPGEVAPAVLPPRLLPVLLLLAAGRPRPAALAAVLATAWTAARLVRTLPQAPGRRWEATRLAVEGTAAAALGLAEAAARPWLPAVLAAGALPGSAGRRARRWGTAAVLVRAARTARGRSVPLPLWLPLRLLDDLAYATGVWAGATRQRRPRVLLPRGR